MEIFAVMVAIVVGYLIGVMQGGIHIYTGQKPVAPREEKAPVYNEDFSHELPPEMQEYFVKNSGFIK